MNSRSLAPLLLLPCLLSCDTERVVALEKRVDLLEQFNRALTEPLLVGALTTSGYPALVDAAGGNFSVAATNNGRLLVRVDRIEERGDGQELTFEIGNPSNMTYSGFTIICRYGSRLEKLEDLEAYQEWKESRRTTQQEFTESLPPGEWTTVSMVVAPATVADVGQVEVTIVAGFVVLKR